MTEPQEAECIRDDRDEAPKPRYSRLAIAALVAAVLGILLVFVPWFTSGLPALLGLLLALLSLALCACGLALGIGAISDIRSSPGKYRGYALAVVAAVVAGSYFAIALLLPNEVPNPHSELMESESNLKQLSMAVISYTTDHDGQFPDPSAWLHVLESERHLSSMEQLVNDPGDRDAGRIYAMNAALTGRHLGETRLGPETVLFFECRTGAPPAGGPELLPTEPRYNRGYVIAFIDGHVEAVRPEEVGDLVWDPRSP